MQTSIRRKLAMRSLWTPTRDWSLRADTRRTRKVSGPRTSSKLGSILRWKRSICLGLQHRMSRNAWSSLALARKQLLISLGQPPISKRNTITEPPAHIRNCGSVKREYEFSLMHQHWERPLVTWWCNVCKFLEPGWKGTLPEKVRNVFIEAFR